jgi:transcriptional regulator with XRE-family HTH domain
MINRELTGKIIRRHRINKKLTQEQLSGLAGLDRTHYSKIERGLRSPNLETLFKIAYALDILPHVLIKAIEEEQK